MSRKLAVSNKDLAVFCRQMNMVIRSDITLREGVKIVSEQTQNPHIKKSLMNVHSIMEKGTPFAQAISLEDQVLPSYLLNMLLLGENSGNLDTVTRQLAEYYEKENYFQSKLRSAAVYPLILLILMTGVILLLLIKVLPTFETILNSLGGDLPVLTRGLLAFGFFIVNFFVIILVIIIALIIICRFYLHTKKGQLFYDKLKLTLPVISKLNLNTLTARFSLSMSILIKSGTPLLTAMEQAANLINNSYLKTKLKVVQDKIRLEKLDLTTALESAGIFPPLFIRMIAIGEKTGNLDLVLEKSAQAFTEESNDTLEKLTIMIEPSLIIILSAIVTIILLSVMLPMINIISSIG